MSVDLVQRSLERRRELFERLSREDTDCYRLFHGVAEGRPGLTLDRYGGVLLLQTWREPLTDAEVAEYHRAIEDACGWGLTPVWHHRCAEPAAATTSTVIGEGPLGHELGVRYDVTPRHRGQDPLLFLDFRAGRRVILARTAGKSVLNLFAYTGGASLCALKGGASEVWNVDFATSAMAWVSRNLALNAFEDAPIRLVREDVTPVVRQLAGLAVKGRGARTRDYERFDARTFDLVVLDPPRWAKSPFGAVDIVRDYPSLLKPSILATSPGGALLLTHNAARVDRDEWSRVLFRTAEKCGRAIDELEWLEPEEDFPSVDDAPPLKMAWIRISL